MRVFRCSCARPSSRRWAIPTTRSIARSSASPIPIATTIRANRQRAAIIEAVKRGVMLTARCRWCFPTISIAESFAHPTSMYLRNMMAMDTEEMIRAQPMDAVIVIGGCDKRFPRRSWRPSATTFRPSSFPGTDGGRPSQGRGAGRLHRLPQAVGANTAPSRSTMSEIEAVNGRLAPSGRHLHGDGHGLDHGLHHRSARPVAAMSATIPAPHAEAFSLGGSERQGRGRDGQGEGAAAERVPHRIVVPECEGGAAGNRRLDQRPHSSHRDRPPHQIQDRSRGFRQARARGAGIDRPETVRRNITWSTFIMPAACQS